MRKKLKGIGVALVTLALVLALLKEYCRAAHPDMQCEALKLPPRKSKDDIPCQWEIKLETKEQGGAK